MDTEILSWIDTGRVVKSWKSADRLLVPGSTGTRICRRQACLFSQLAVSDVHRLMPDGGNKPMGWCAVVLGTVATNSKEL